MLSWRIRRDDLAWSSNLSIARHLIQTLMVCGWVLISLAVQGQIPQARITSVTGAVTLQRSGAAIPLPLKRGELLQLSDVIDTGTGSVVIAMHDGSQVTVYPGSRVLLKDFRSVTSWRDLLEVVVGRVRVKINHYGKRPNPYRVYSPIASIAVRGTEFLVLVESNTETRVLVFEGLVEVSSLISPGQSALVKPGRNVVVRPDGGLDLVSTAPRNNLNQVYSAMGLQDSYEEHDRNYAQYRAPRYLAFSDSHLDSLQNPAYATEFRQRSGRLYLMPSFITQADTGFFTDELDPRDRTRGDLNYTLSPQLSYFTPLGSRFVVGGGATLAKTDLRGNGADIYSQDGIYRRYDGTTRFTTLNLSVIAARRFGEAERTSVGLKFDYIDDQSMYAVTTSESDNSSGQVERGDSRVRRLGFSVGLTHDFGGDKKLGLYYHYDTGTVRGQERRTDFYTTAEPGVYRYVQLNSASTKPKYTSEIGIRFRASLTPRLFYGVEGSLLLDRGRLTREGLNDLIESTLDRRATLGVGFGYALRPRTILIADLTAGFKREGDRERTDFYSNYFRDGRLVDRRLDGFTEDDRNDRYLYGSMHLGAQTDLWRNFFAGGSAIIVGYKRTYKYRYVSEYFPYPRNDRSYRYLRSSQYYTYDFNIGRRLKPGWTMQYAYEPGLGVDAPSHSVILRYDFGGKKRESY